MDHTNHGPHYEEIHVYFVPSRGRWEISVERYYGPGNTDSDPVWSCATKERAEAYAREYCGDDTPVIIHLDSETNIV